MQLKDAVAVIGLSGRFPGAGSTERFWENVAAGAESLTRFTEEELAEAGVPPAEYGHPSYVPVRGVLDDVELFDAELFGYSPREAELIDPQQRILLQCAWEALESGGHGGRSGRTGVFVGTSMSTYLLRHLLPRPELERTVGLLPIMLGNDKEHAATRIAYKLGLTGPAVAVQTACSTSLVAVHHAARSVLRGECDTALAGGASVVLPQRSGYLFQRHGILSPDGHCRAFDRRAAGTVAGSGAGLVLLKRAQDAVRDGDVIRALIRGSAVNNDGGDKAGYTAPSVSGQTAVIRAALAAAAVHPDEIGYVETHGTGTELGDGIEIAALTAAYREHTDRREYCAIGSLKPNIGHLDAAAGIASLIKAVLALEHRVLPPTINCDEPNPDLRLPDSPFFVNRTARPWPSESGPRLCAVSSFGIGGTNAHVILQEAPAAPERQEPADRPVILVQSAATAEALAAATEALAERVEADRPRLDDVGHTLQTGRSHLAWRRAATATSTGALRSVLAAAPVGAVPRVSSLVFQFPGQGTQYAGMAAALHREVPSFRATLERCLDALEPGLRSDMARLLTTERPTAADDAEFGGTRLTQPALFVTQYALAHTLTQWGLRPKALIGHSVGEYTAACLAGGLALDDALRLVAARGEIMARAPRGAMLAVMADETTVRALLRGSLAIAAVNAPAVTVVGGTPADVAEAAGRLAAEGIDSKPLRVGHAFHTGQMDPVVEEFRERAAPVAYARLRIPVVSNVTGDLVNRRRGYSADYWARHLREPVRYGDGLARVLDLPHPVLIEVGPGRSLTGLALHQPGATRATLVSTMPSRPAPAGESLRILYDALAAAWSAGAVVDWEAFATGTAARRVALPTYPFARDRHWIGPPDRTAGEPPSPTDGPPADATDLGAPAGARTESEAESEAECERGSEAEVEQVLAGIWSRLLGVRGIGPDADFFDLGGHSLVAVPLLVAVQEAFGVELSLNETYRAPTLGAQAALIRARRTTAGPAAAAPAHPGNEDHE